MKLIHKQGDVTNPTESGNLFIIHCCNDCYPVPVMGSGVALALLNKWSAVREEYLKWGKRETTDTYYSCPQLRLGEIQIVDVQGDFSTHTGIAVVNMIGQRDVCNFEDMPPIRYEAIKECLWNVRRQIEYENKEYGPINIVAPKFGSDRAGGDWNKIESIIHEVFDGTDINFTVYSL